MSDERTNLTGRIDRRGFLVGGASALAATTALADGEPTGGQAPTKKNRAAELPKRPLGRTGVKVSMLNLGTWLSPGGDRLLRFAWANGIHYVDTAKSYGSEPMIGRWLNEVPVPRKQLFLSTKDQPESPHQLIEQLDERLEALQTDYVDLIYLHALGDRNFDLELQWLSSPELKTTADAIRKSGKAKFVGFSTHHQARHLLLQAAAQSGFLDVIMLQNNPWIAADDDMNRALDAVAKRGIALVSMKQVAGNMNLEEIGMNLGGLGGMTGGVALTPYQALLHAIWTDDRFSSVCVSMRNTDQIRENSAAARAFKPLHMTQIDRLRDACIAAGPTMCASCDGRCARAAGTAAELGNLTRFLTYHDHHGYRAEARRLYTQLDEKARDWHGADLEAARQACPNQLNFAKLLPRADEVLG
jgi:aryl-alcohol dehydrogenase-like predicted oxidoreductase